MLSASKAGLAAVREGKATMRPTKVTVSVTIAAALAMTVTACGSTGSTGSPATTGSSSSSASGSTSGTWRIGVEAPLTGDQATLGQGMLQGAQLAADQVNSKGGVLGRRIEIITIDDAADPATGVKAATTAIAGGLNGVVGPYNSAVGVQTLPLYLRAGIVPIRLTSDNSTDGLGFTLQPMTNQIAPVTSTAITKFFGAQSVGIIYDSTQNYTKSTSSAVKGQLEAAGVKVTSFDPITPGQSSYADVLAKVNAKNPDVIYSAVYYPEGAKIAQEITPSSGTASTPGGSRCLLDYASYDSGYITAAGATAAANCAVVGVPAPSDFPASAGRVAQFRQSFHQPPGTWAPYTFDSLNFLLDGAQQSGGFDAKALTTELGKVTGWNGWTGAVTIDAKTGNRTPATVVVTAVKDGQLRVDAAWAKAVGAPY